MADDIVSSRFAPRSRFNRLLKNSAEKTLVFVVLA
jgi:hypothetical protein